MWGPRIYASAARLVEKKMDPAHRATNPQRFALQISSQRFALQIEKKNGPSASRYKSPAHRATNYSRFSANSQIVLLFRVVSLLFVLFAVFQTRYFQDISKIFSRYFQDIFKTFPLSRG